MGRNYFLKIMFLLVLSILTIPFMTQEAKAFTITDDGEYAVVLKTGEGEIDGTYGKVIKFNFDENEKSIKVSDITKGIIPYNGETAFAGWTMTRNDTIDKIVTELKIDDFISQGEMNGVSYKNGCSLYARFSDKSLDETENYYLKIDGFGGKVNGQYSILLVINKDEFKTIDLSKYVAQREGCTFCGWDYDGEVVMSIDKSYFSKTSNVVISAVYKSNNFYGVDENGRLNDPNLPEDMRPFSYVLTLDANGGTIEGQKSKKYDYLGGADSGTKMKIFQYIPERRGYIFKGWNAKKNGSGDYLKYMYWRSWRNSNDESSKFDKDGLIEDGNVYTNITLYAVWEKDPNYSETREITSTSGINGSVTFLEWVDDINYSLQIKELDVPESLAKENVKYLVDIFFLNDNQEIVEVNGFKIKVKFKMPDNLKDYDAYKIVFTRNGKIIEQLDAAVEDGYITFETMHLSDYGIVATKKQVETTTSNNDNKGSNTNTTVNNNINTKLSVKKVIFKQVTRTKNNKKIKLKFKKIAGAKGYEIKYSTSKKFGKKVTKTVKTKYTTKMLSKLKKKTYYIKVRAYKVVEGKTYNSKWSSVKKVRTRK